MLIEISLASGPIDYNGYTIYCKNKRILNLKEGYSRVFWEDDIFDLLGENQYKSFESGKYKFNVTKKDIFRVSKDPDYYL